VPLRWVDPPVTAFMLSDASGRAPVLYDWHDWIDIGATPTLAVVAASLKKFVEHHGFDLQAIEDAIASYERGAPLRGASTISQQVAKNLYLWPGRSFLRKGLEAWLTVLIEMSWPKRRIIEIYLNVAEFGPGIYGVPAATRVFFRLEPVELSDPQAALLAAVLPNPHQLQVDRPSPYVRQRQRWILKQMDRLRQQQWVAQLR
jgi:monofunctional biosynthetic peptidoglycan transglycosylase